MLWYEENKELAPVAQNSEAVHIPTIYDIFDKSYYTYNRTPVGY